MDNQPVKFAPPAVPHAAPFPFAPRVPLVLTLPTPHVNHVRPAV